MEKRDKYKYYCFNWLFQANLNICEPHISGERQGLKYLEGAPFSSTGWSRGFSRIWTLTWVGYQNSRGVLNLHDHIPNQKKTGVFAPLDIFPPEHTIKKLQGMKDHSLTVPTVFGEKLTKLLKNIKNIWKSIKIIKKHNKYN